MQKAQLTLHAPEAFRDLHGGVLRLQQTSDWQLSASCALRTELPAWHALLWNSVYWWLTSTDSKLQYRQKAVGAVLSIDAMSSADKQTSYETFHTEYDG